MHIISFLQDFVRSNPGMVASNLSFSFLIPVQDVMLPHFYGKLINALITDKDIVKYIVYVIAIFMFLEIGFVLSDWHDIYTSSGFQTFTRQEILKNLLQKYENNFSDLYIGNLMSKVVKIPYTLVIWYERLKYAILPYILVFSFAVCYFAGYDKILGIALLITAVIYAICIIGIPQTMCRHPATEKDHMVNEIHEQIDDTLRNFISMHGDKDKQQHEVERLQNYEKLFTTKFADTMKCLMKTKIITSVIIISFTIIFILRSYILLRKKKLTAASFSSLFLILIYINGAMMSLESQLREMIFDWGIITESDELFEKHNKKNHLKQQKPMMPKDGKIPQEPGIGMKNVGFTFPGGANPILQDITFHVNKGDTVVILGNIGSGKSTILKLFLRLNNPDYGCIYINGKPYSDIDIKDVKRQVGFVPQQPLLFDRTVIENILYGTENITKEQVETFIKNIGVEKEFVNLEHGIDSKVGKNGSKLSGGQRQIVLCLRVFFQNPEFIVMDEPTASLDTTSKETLKMLLNVIMKDKTVIIVTHDNELLEIANKKIYVENGVIRKPKDKLKGYEPLTEFYMENGLLSK